VGAENRVTRPDQRFVVGPVVPKLGYGR
jgi:hypothetical protein